MNRNPFNQVTAMLIATLLPAALLASSNALSQAGAAACAGRSGEERATCLREEAAARQELKRGRLDDAGADYRKNALERCRPLSGPERDDCIRRVEGGGVSSGSIESGGIYRETRSLEPGPSPPPEPVDLTPR
ncbi:hypothetical protein [Lacisediminimonas profundi]|uniref:hypothetical protein n=1 Tax=Lacisediminimonas profundi TaxID=2603856 RepID=UPI00124B93EA|nr:hypothetical protein [Lacisediminimonas profundi]